MSVIESTFINEDNKLSLDSFSFDSLCNRISSVTATIIIRLCKSHSL